MVALKQGQPAQDQPPGGQKQERRGGIETGEEPQDPILYLRKQERRGGIETKLPLPSAPQGQTGSRNAVVALKLMTPPVATAPRSGSRNAVVALKLPIAEKTDEDSSEAGTPWWH